MNDIKEILRLHSLWLDNDPSGVRANFSLGSLEGANFSGANLRRANFTVAYLRGANLRGANLEEANLRKANLEEANLKGANLEGAYLKGANLERANLERANLRKANLEEANLEEANLERANLKGANLLEANLLEANLEKAKLPDFQIPEGDLRVYKKCKEGIVRLAIPLGARRTASLVGRKCRAEIAVVLKTPNNKPATSLHDNKTIYIVGETVRPNSYNDDIRIECAQGIHFFLTREETEGF